jgi:hypothetical protein
MRYHQHIYMTFHVLLQGFDKRGDFAVPAIKTMPAAIDQHFMAYRFSGHEFKHEAIASAHFIHVDDYIRNFIRHDSKGLVVV